MEQTTTIKEVLLRDIHRVGGRRVCTLRYVKYDIILPLIDEHRFFVDLHALCENEASEVRDLRLW